MKKKIDEASFNELLTAGQNLGLDVKHGRNSKDELRDMLRAATLSDEIEVEDVSPFASSITPIQAGGDPGHSRHDPKVTISITPNKEAYGKHVPVCVNGDNLVLEVGKEVSIPYRHYLALKNAVEIVLTQEQDSRTGELIEVETPAYTIQFNVLSLPSQAEIDAFHERTRDIKSGMRKAA